MLGPTARPDHALRSGTVYYRNPRPGQWGLNVAPTPPWDKGGPHEDGPPGLKKFCRCWLGPVFARLHKEGVPADYFVDKGQKLIPDPHTYDQWFKQANRQQREIAVGVRRYAQAEETLGREPEWADLLDPDWGRLLTVEKIKNETAIQRMKRLAAVQRIISDNRLAQARELRLGA
jgi:hypothetical protein